jgi:hypothetical protein
MAKPTNVKYWELHRMSKLDGATVSVTVDSAQWTKRTHNEVVRSLQRGYTTSYHGKAASFANAIARPHNIDLWRLIGDKDREGKTYFSLFCYVPKGITVDDPRMAAVNEATKVQIARDKLLGRSSYYYRGDNESEWDMYKHRVEVYGWVSFNGISTVEAAMQHVQMLDTAFRTDEQRQTLQRLTQQVIDRETFIFQQEHIHGR